MNIFLILRTQLMHLVISVINSVSSEQPLIFIPQTLEVFDFEGESNTYNGGPYAAACPADHGWEFDFMKRFSVNYRSLFIRHYSDNRDENLGKITCKTPVKLSLAFYLDEQVDVLQFGYEIFYHQSEFFNKKFYEKSYYQGYRRITEDLTWFKRYFAGSSFGKHVPYKKNIISKTAANSSVDSPLMGFQFIPRIELSYKKSSRSITRFSYTVEKMADKPWVTCKNYTLDNELSEHWYKESPDNYYSFKNQEMIFRTLQYPEDTCESKYDCLKKYSLVPPYHLKSTTFKSISCANSLTTPLWHKMLESRLNYLDKFLIAVAQIADKKLKVKVTQHGVVSLPISEGKWRKNKEIYLQGKKKIPVPKIILKVVKYDLYDCIVLDGCRFYTIIVIHNHPEVTKEDKLCEKDLCEDYGWGSIRYGNTAKQGKQSDHVYCCEPNKKLGKLINFNETSFNFLNLKKFPYYNEETGQNEYSEDKLELIEKMVNKLIKLEETDGKNSLRRLFMSQDDKITEGG